VTEAGLLAIVAPASSQSVGILTMNDLKVTGLEVLRCDAGWRSY
jgi:hypothetical protein